MNFITISVTCPECRGRGWAEYEYIDSRRFFDPYQTVELTCQKCHGACEIETEVCSLCRRDENGCRCHVALMRLAA